MSSWLLPQSPTSLSRPSVLAHTRPSFAHAVLCGLLLWDSLSFPCVGIPPLDARVLHCFSPGRGLGSLSTPGALFCARAIRPGPAKGRGHYTPLVAHSPPFVPLSMLQVLVNSGAPPGRSSAPPPMACPSPIACVKRGRASHTRPMPQKAPVVAGWACGRRRGRRRHGLVRIRALRGR